MRSALVTFGIAFGLCLSATLWYAFGFAFLALGTVCFIALWLAFEVVVARRVWTQARKAINDSHERFETARHAIAVERHEA